MPLIPGRFSISSIADCKEVADYHRHWEEACKRASDMGRAEEHARSYEAIEFLIGKLEQGIQGRDIPPAELEGEDEPSGKPGKSEAKSRAMKERWATIKKARELTGIQASTIAEAKSLLALHEERSKVPQENGQPNG